MSLLPDAPNVHSETHQEIIAWLTNFQRVVLRMKVQEFINLTDWDEFVKRAVESSGVTLNAEQSKLIRQAMMTYNARLFPQVREFYLFAEAEIRRIDVNEDEATVVARIYGADGTEFKARWWLHKDGPVWRMVDFENLTVAIRMSVMVTMGLELGESGTKLPPSTAGDFVEMGAAAQEGEFERVVAISEKLQDLPLPPSIIEIVLLAKLEALFGLDDDEGVADLVAKLEEKNCANPLYFYYRGQISYLDGQLSEALRWLQEYDRAVGHDSETWPTAFECLIETGDRKSARQAAARWVSEYPDSVYGIYCYWSVMRKNRRAEVIRPLLMKVPDPDNSLLEFGIEAEYADDVDGLDLLIDVMTQRKCDPNSIRDFSDSLDAARKARKMRKNSDPED